MGYLKPLLNDKVMNLCLYVGTPLLSYLGGFFAYVLTLQIVWGQSLGGDARAVLFWGGIAFFSLAVPVYFGIIYFIDNRFEKCKGLLYPVGCMVIFMFPTLVITSLFGSINLLSPEALLFHSFFLTSGLIFGLCSWILKKIQSKTKLKEAEIKSNTK